MYGETAQVIPGPDIPRSLDRLGQQTPVERQPLLNEALEMVQRITKDVHDLANMVQANADSMVGARLEAAKVSGNGGALPPPPSGRGHQLLNGLHVLQDALRDLRVEVDRLRAV